MAGVRRLHGGYTTVAHLEREALAPEEVVSELIAVVRRVQHERLVRHAERVDLSGERRRNDRVCVPCSEYASSPRAATPSDGHPRLRRVETSSRR